MDGAVQRAELFRNVDELMEFKEAMQRERREIRAWMASIDERIDVYNRRLRKLEKIAKLHKGELSVIIRSMRDETQDGHS